MDRFRGLFSVLALLFLATPAWLSAAAEQDRFEYWQKKDQLGILTDGKILRIDFATDPPHAILLTHDGKQSRFSMDTVHRILFGEGGRGRLFTIETTKRFTGVTVSRFENGQFFARPAGVEKEFPVGTGALKVFESEDKNAPDTAQAVAAAQANMAEMMGEGPKASPSAAAPTAAPEEEGEEIVEVVGPTAEEVAAINAHNAELLAKKKRYVLVAAGCGGLAVLMFVVRLLSMSGKKKK